MDKVIKSIGFCCDGCGWTFCSFFKDSDDVVIEMNNIKLKAPNLNPQQKCNLFGGAKLLQGKSLHVCDVVYGHSYEGTP